MRHLTYLSWLALVGSIALFATLIYLAGVIQDQAHVRAALAADREQEIDRSTYAQRVRAVIAETEDERAALDAFGRLDVVTVVEMLEAVGQSAGVKVTVAGADTEGGTALTSGEVLQPTVFSVNASGSYAALMHAAELYERLPLAVQIEQLVIQRDSAESGRVWNLAMRIRILAITPAL